MLRGTQVLGNLEMHGADTSCRDACSNTNKGVLAQDMAARYLRALNATADANPYQATGPDGNLVLRTVPLRQAPGWIPTWN
jgi:hypothetical protein